MRWLFTLCLIWTAITAGLCDEPVVVEQKNSTSPDKLYYVALVQEIPGDGADCSLQIRSRIDKKVLATFDWEQFSNNLSDDVAVSWTKDSKAFALSELFGRGWGGSLVYFHLPNSSWTDVEIPLPDTGHPSKEGWETRDKGHYYADHWIGNDVLVLDYLNPTYRNASKVTNVFDPEYTHSHYSVSLQLIKGSNGKPAFKQIALHELPEPE